MTLYVYQYLRLRCPCLLARAFFSPLLARGPPSCLVDTAMGLAHCHENDVIVCDLKPNNIILVHDGLRYVGKVSDFGLACGEYGK